ncbi:hypothetical protein [Nonomuraea sediminis]|uniref:hypothetical protein n=1 Tax=Nonomuraea sediminis TaxID=2835864 RepID=UPI001BDD6470|nr:hypothetical protein [Nonomuraea sediminis]
MIPETVLNAFGLSGPPVPLGGGQGTSVRVGDAVLKPVDSREETEWTSRLYASLPTAPGFRVPRPLHSPTGEYMVEGWAAAE